MRFSNAQVNKYKRSAMCVKRNVRRDKIYSLKLASNGMIDFYSLKLSRRFNMQI